MGMTFFLYLNLIKLYNNHKKAIKRRKSVKEKIIEKLIKDLGNYVSGERLSEELGVTRTAIWKNINTLREEGYIIHSLPRKGYILKDTPDILSQIEIQNGLDTKILGKEILHYDSISSTNDLVKELALKNGKEGLVIISEEQIKGRGRRGRNWQSPKGKGIWMSILLRPDIPPKEGPKFTLLSAVAVTKAIKEATGIEGKIKWPNDIIVNNKKVCGILTEMNAEMDLINYIIIGIGINVNGKTEDFSHELKDRAISLSQVKGDYISRKEIVRKILENIENYYLEFIQSMDFSDILEEWKGLSCNLGKEVRAIVKGREIIGQAIDINKDGSLILKTKDGEAVEIIYGDVKVRGIDDYV